MLYVYVICICYMYMLYVYVICICLMYMLCVYVLDIFHNSVKDERSRSSSSSSCCSTNRSNCGSISSDSSK